MALLRQQFLEGESFLLHPATLEFMPGEAGEADDERVSWFARGDGDARLGFWLAGGHSVADAPVVMESSEGQLSCVGCSIEEFIVLFNSYDGQARLEKARAWLESIGVTVQSTAAQIEAGLPKLPP